MIISALDKRILTAFVLNITTEKLLLDDVALDNAQSERLEQLLRRRAAGEPVSKIIGRKEFWSLDFKTTGATLDPRPDSETLVEAVLRHISEKDKLYNIVDFGTGTGCLLLSVLSEYPNATGVGVDISPDALSIAQENAQLLGLSDRATFQQSEWGAELDGEGVFDIILSNPPYIPSEVIPTLEADVAEYDPMLALDGGADGLDEYRRLLPDIARLLAPQAYAFIEIGARAGIRRCYHRAGCGFAGD